ncbi:Carboxypeptidase regulatory-like domain-containing protein [Natronorubrum sediminis]|uniref:Carboxypeptidase regulatory-like domain-containing protein n=1 Tax=Natronorubrum sediminis TaxID=640943 RepID=A0A1H6FQJ2_9EURY|nr:carboxypeptidase regulatory-like domain-containing protein [Natronorubrum sediminis]SEH13167.1 Carboxypeptidase regulatory-like domain-containing protein [Natronorubrum sediminis]
MQDLYGVRRNRNERRNRRITALAAIAVLLAVGAIGAAALPLAVGGESLLASGSDEPSEATPPDATLETTASEHDDATQPVQASSDSSAEYEVTPSDAEGEPGERVSVDVDARTLTDDDDADISGYDLRIDYDDEQVELTDADTYLDDDEELEVDANDGSADVEWTPSGLEIIGDELTDSITDGDSMESMNATIVTLEFVVVGEPGETGDVDIDDDSQIWDGATGLSEYDDDELNWGEGTVEVAGESDEGDDGEDENETDEESPENQRVAEFSAVSQDGFVAFDESSQSDAESEGVSFPAEDDGETPIELDGAVYGDGTWESTDVSFPTLDAGAADADVEARNGLHGEFDEDADEMTVEGELTVLVDGDEDRSFSFDIDGTTGDSGELSGSGDFDDSAASASLVDNEFLVEDTTGDTVIDSALGLPSTNEGDNWFDLALDLEIEESDSVTGTVEGTVEDDDGEPIDGATVDAADGGPTAETDDDGTYDLVLESGATELTVDADGYAEETVETDVGEAETTTEDVTLEGEESSTAVSIEADDATAGETVTVDATVENVGDDAVEQEVTVSVSDEETTETVALDAGDSETVTLEWDVDEDDVDEHTAEVESEDDHATTDVSVDKSSKSDGESPEGEEGDVDEDEDAFVATSQGGFISFAEDADREVALEEGLEFPSADEDDEYIQIVGVIDDGTWESTSTSFPNLETDSGIEAEVTAPDGLEGEIDEEGDEMSVEGELEVAIEGDSDRQFSFEIDTTTGESEDLTGDADFEDDHATTSLVDNEFLVEDETGDSIIDSELDLPADEAGTNWFELDLDLELDVDDEEVDDTESSSDAESDDEDDTDGESATGSSTAVAGFGQLLGALGVIAAIGALGIGAFSRFTP